MHSRSLIPAPINFTGKLGLLLGLIAIGFAIVPILQHEEKSVGEKFVDDVKDAFSKYERHVEDDSRFTFSMEGDDKWSSLAMGFAVAALALGIVSLATEILSGGLAVVIGIAVGVWMYLAR